MNKFGRRQAALDVWVGMIGAIVPFDRAGDEEHYVSVAGDRYLQKAVIV